MLQNRNVTTALSLVLLVGACSTPADHAAPLSDDLRQDLAAAASSSGDLAATPQSYQPMRFVSSVERSRAGAPAKRTAIAHHHVRAAHARRPAPEAATRSADAMDEMVAEAATPVATPEAPRTEPAVIAHQPANEPVDAPSNGRTGSGGEVGAGNRGQGGGWGGILGGLIGAAVIRGGIGAVDKCDPRTDGRHPTIIDRPDFGLPSGIGTPTFPRSRRR
jgi:hypothetical protein